MVEGAPGVSRRAPLAGTDQVIGPGIASALASIRVLPAQARFSLRVDELLLSQGGAVGGFALGQPVNSRSVSGEKVAMRLGPDEWLLSAPADEDLGIAADIETDLAGRHHSLVDVGHRYVAFAVSGRHAADVLNAGCPLDLSSAAFPSGTATRTLLGKCEIILARLDDALVFEVACGRSFAQYVRDFLVEAARELRALDQ